MMMMINLEVGYFPKPVRPVVFYSPYTVVQSFPNS